ncbi:hypothetical protein E2C01_068661 [Portunus trituberculatus]|uniref:Uncharacterized protein n=1 Tax=Portunus trituberculatus TaxID=210409 RepID=A0A5B7I0P1_PORTR|nr:hypothetical protein [Portunus trituberculatus]
MQVRWGVAGGAGGAGVHGRSGPRTHLCIHAGEEKLAKEVSLLSVRRGSHYSRSFLCIFRK